MNMQLERFGVTKQFSRSANPRTCTPAQIALIAASIRDFGGINLEPAANPKGARVLGPNRRPPFNRSKRKEG
jgi:hypothetical protein